MLFLFSSSFSQYLEGRFQLEGFVTDSRDGHPLEGVTIQLVRADAITTETISDSLGYYQFPDLYKRISYTAFPIAGNAGVSAPVKYGRCPYSYIENVGYMNGRNSRIDGSDTMKAEILQIDFKLNKILSCDFHHPEICFKKNSIEFLSPNCDSLSAETVIDCMVAYLNAHPTYVFEIAGYAHRKEKKADELSQKRAELLKGFFTKKGIDPERLVAKGYGSDVSYKLSGLNEEIKIPENRAEFNILRKDYGLPKNAEE